MAAEVITTSFKRLDSRSVLVLESEPDTKIDRVYGKTPNGVVFEVPYTEDMIRALFDPRIKKSITDLAIVLILGSYILLYYLLPSNTRIYVFGILFAFWRLMYNGGIGWLLYHQSKSQWMTKLAKNYGLFEKKNESEFWQKVLKYNLESKIVNDYNFYETPLEYNTWLVFRHFVDLVLMSDFTNYMLLAASCYTTTEQPVLLKALRWTSGAILFLFNLWVKLDAHRIVKDYAWYWGDFFFTEDVKLIFDGVFELAPHPMYSIGYAGFYGICLITASYTLFFASVIAHIAQFVFLVFVENPHIEKIYNPPKENNKRKSMKSMADEHLNKMETSYLNRNNINSENIKSPKLPALIIIKNFTLARTTDILTVIIVLNTMILAIVPKTKWWTSITFLLAVFWRLVQTWGVGAILVEQSKNKSWFRLFLKYGLSIEASYEQWQVLYNISTVMSYLSLIVFCYREKIPIEFVSLWGFKQIFGSILIVLQLWGNYSIYQELGEYGWFFGDFFFPEEAKHLKYTGIYRYLNNPEQPFGVVGVWGLAIISESLYSYFMAILWTITGMFFIKFVERPHMMKLYGNQIKEAGVAKTIKKASKHAPESVKMILEFHSTIDRSLDVAAFLWFNFINNINDWYHSKLSHTNAIDNTVYKNVRERKVHFNDDYIINIDKEGSKNNELDFEFGTPIKISWIGPHHKKDWIGLYKVTDNKSVEISTCSTQGHWSATDKSGYSTHVSGVQSCGTNFGSVIFAGDLLTWETGLYHFRLHKEGSHQVVALSRPFRITIDKYLIKDIGSIGSKVLQLTQKCFVGSSYIPPLTIYENWGEITDVILLERISYGILNLFGVEFSSGVILADQNVFNLTNRILQSQKILDTAESYQKTK